MFITLVAVIVCSGEIFSFISCFNLPEIQSTATGGADTVFSGDTFDWRGDLAGLAGAAGASIDTIFDGSASSGFSFRFAHAKRPPIGLSFLDGGLLSDVADVSFLPFASVFVDARAKKFPGC